MNIRTGDPPDGQPSGSRRLLVSVFISVGALFLAAIHLLRPKANIDAVTLLLIAVAAVPWLAPIFKTIELPGGWRFEYQDLRRGQQQIRQELAQVHDSVKKVERIIFSQEVSSDLAQQLRDQLEQFHNYLAALGLAPYEREPPKIGLKPYRTGSYYDPESHRIEISPDLANNPHVLFREYCNYAFTPDNESIESRYAFWDIKSGLGFYLPCSFTGEPAGFAPFGINMEDTRKMIERLGEPSVENQERSLIWASIFWDARQLVDPRVEDKLLAATWLATIEAASNSITPPSQPPEQITYGLIEERFIGHLLRLAPAEESQSLRDLLTWRGVKGG